MKLCRLRYGCMLLCIAGVACRTMSPAPPPDIEETVPPMPRGYQPMSYVSTIHWESGEYPDLFSSEASAVWVNGDVAEMKYANEARSGTPPSPRLVAQAQAISRDFFVFECHIESVFRDTSIAYDVVGFRGIEVHLETPDGTLVRPIQTIIGTPVEEEQHGALKLFRRTNIVVFPRHNLWTGTDTVAVGSRSVRLVLSGQNSEFYFEWPEMPLTALEEGWSWRPSESEAYQALKVSFSDLYGRLRRLAHTFD